MIAAMGRSKNARGFTLIEVITGAAILAILSLMLSAANYPAMLSIRAAKSETVNANMAFAVLEAVRVQAPDLDLNGDLGFENLGLANPNHLKVTVSKQQDSVLPDLYTVTVRVEEENGHGIPVTMHTLVRKCSH